MYLFIVLILCTCDSIVKSCNLQSKPLDVFHYIPTMDGIQCYGDGILFEVSRSNLLSCAIDCMDADVCFGFSYEETSEKCIGCIGSTTNFMPGAPGNKGFAVDWLPLDEHHAIRVSSLELDFNDAVEYCKCQGAIIARLDSQEKTTFIKDLAWKHVSVWIGLTDEGHEGVWTWVHGGDEANFTDWHNGDSSKQPNGGDLQNCAAISIGYGYTWADKRCSLKERVLCEKQI